MASCAAIVGLAACGSSSGGGSSDGGSGNASVKVLQYPGSDVSWLAYIAQKRGYFSQHHLDVSFVSLPAGQQGTAALVGGSVDIAVLDTNNMAPLLAKGQKYSLLVNALTNFQVLVGNKSMAGDSLQKAITSLKGQSVNAPSVAGTGALQVQTLAAETRG